MRSLGVEGGRAWRMLGWALCAAALLGLVREGRSIWRVHLATSGPVETLGASGALWVSQVLVSVGFVIGVVAALASMGLIGPAAAGGNRARAWAWLAALGLSMDAAVDGGWLGMTFGASLSVTWLERLGQLWMVNLLAMCLWAVGVLTTVAWSRRVRGAPAWDRRGALAAGSWGALAALLCWQHLGSEALAGPRGEGGLALAWAVAVALVRTAPFALTGLVCLREGRRAPRAVAWVPARAGAGAELADYAQLLVLRIGVAVAGTVALLVARLAEVQGALRLLAWLVPSASVVLGGLMLRAVLRYGRATDEDLPAPGRAAAHAAAVALGLGLAVECYAFVLGLDLTGSRLGPALAAMRRLPWVEVAAAGLGPAAVLCMAAVARAVGRRQDAPALVREAGRVQALWCVVLAVAVGARVLLLQRDPLVGLALAAVLLALVLAVMAVLRLLRLLRAAASALPAVP